MTLPVLVVRPQPGCDATVSAARARGVAAQGFPLFEIRPIAWEAPDAREYDALLLASANTLRHGGPALERYRSLPVYAVGETTARVAREAGFDVIETGAGGLQSVIEMLAPEHRRLLRLGGRERVELGVPGGVVIEDRTVYASEALAMPPALLETLASPVLVLLHSGRAASHFGDECDRHGVARRDIAIAALAPRIAAAAGTGWRTLRTAPETTDAALLALADEMCKETG